MIIFGFSELSSFEGVGPLLYLMIALISSN